MEYEKKVGFHGDVRPATVRAGEGGVRLVPPFRQTQMADCQAMALTALSVTTNSPFDVLYLESLNSHLPQPVLDQAFTKIQARTPALHFALSRMINIVNLEQVQGVLLEAEKQAMKGSLSGRQRAISYVSKLQANRARL